MTALALVLAVVAAATGIVLYIRRSALDSAALDQAEAVIAAANARRKEQEAEDAIERSKRTREFEDKADIVADGGSAADAIDLLRDAASRLGPR